MAASVMATSGDASKRNKMETIRLTTPEIRTAVRIFFTVSTATAMMMMMVARKRLNMIVAFINFPPLLDFRHRQVCLKQFFQTILFLYNVLHEQEYVTTQD